MAGNSGGRGGTRQALTTNTAPNPVDNAMSILGLVSSVFSNTLNQANRLGGTDVPLYDPDLQYSDVFRNAGYGEGVSNAAGLVASVVEPGPGEFQALMRMLPDIAAMMFVPKALQELAATRLHPTLIGDDALPRQGYHGTPSVYGENLNLSDSGRYGAGRYNTHTNTSGSSYAMSGVPDLPLDAEVIDQWYSANRLTNPNVRFETPMLTNPLIVAHGAPLTPVRVNQEAFDGLMQGLTNRLTSGSISPTEAQSVQRAINALNKAAASTDGIDVNTFRLIQQAAQGSSWRSQDAIAFTQQLGRALGIDGIVEPAGAFTRAGETVTFDPRNVVTHSDQLIEWLRRQNVPEDEIAAVMRRAAREEPPVTFGPRPNPATSARPEVRQAERSDIYGWVGGPHASEMVPGYYVDAAGQSRSPLEDFVNQMAEGAGWKPPPEAGAPLTTARRPPMTAAQRAAEARRRNRGGR